MANFLNQTNESLTPEHCVRGGAEQSCAQRLGSVLKIRDPYCSFHPSPGETEADANFFSG